MTALEPVFQRWKWRPRRFRPAGLCCSNAVITVSIGQSIMHTLCDEFDYVYYLFHDESNDKRIEKSIRNDREDLIIEKMWKDFNVLIKFV